MWTVDYVHVFINLWVTVGVKTRVPACAPTSAMMEIYKKFSFIYLTKNVYMCAYTDRVPVMSLTHLTPAFNVTIAVLIIGIKNLLLRP